MQTIQRTIQILKSFSVENKRLSMADLHRITGLPKSTLQRILTTLVMEGFLDKDEKSKTYQLGIEIYFLGHLVEKNSSLLSVSTPVMERIRDQTGEMVTLNVIHQNQRKCIGYVQGKHELTTFTYIGHTSPLYAGASAKILFAYLPEKEIENYLQTVALKQLTEKTITNKALLRKELASIRRQGYAISYGERVKGAFTISGPIFDRSGQIIAGLSLGIPTARSDDYNHSELISLVKEGCNEISQKIGYQPVK
ncbi:DNA-binding IclR family transcriptional regulator [Caldalkalibacillus uzonensis]|uniref:DNA-binding IclR family transcriptional regulator n=1 Tax=Caldalkalibacillus uzonensis TaxID=353224 RepID=A0ABU0CXM6_9BACI|nr:IclR family transcriptional regulator [Caldalkalibacillus uzonensis]MDQ0340815.1 DNA-binding IclR family transcriptional regulator [Caldalkalibacillus uzonensis]